MFSNFRMIIPGKIYKTENIKQDGLKLIFYPPAKPFQICLYHCRKNFEIPIIGNFQKKEISPNVYKILVTLNFNKEIIKKILELEVEIYLKKDFKIVSTDLKIQTGTVKFNNKSKSLIWTITGFSI